MTKLTFFTKDECPLCDAAKFVIDRVSHQFVFELEVIDITQPDNAGWFERYKNDIPVLHIDDEERFKHRVDEGKLRAALLRMKLEPRRQRLSELSE